MAPPSFRRLSLAALLGVLVACGGDSPEPPAPHVFHVDHSVSPCGDFYAYVNNPWQRTAELAPHEKVTGLLYEMDAEIEEQLRVLLESPSHTQTPAWWRMVQQLYHDALDEPTLENLGFEPARPEWERIAALDSKAALRQYLRDRQARGIPEVFEVSVTPHVYRPEQMVLNVDAKPLGLPRADYYLDEAHAEIAAAYRRYLQQLLVQAGLSTSQAHERAKLAFDLEKHLAANFFDPLASSDLSDDFLVVTHAEAEAYTPGWGWSELLLTLGLDPTAPFLLEQSDYFPAVNRLIEDLPLTQWQAYLQAKWLDRSASSLDRHFRQIRFDFRARYLHGAEEEQRWSEVLSELDDTVGELLGRAYVEHHLVRENKARAEALMTELRAALRERLLRLDWLQESTRQEAVRKVDLLRVSMAYPHAWRDWEGVSLEPAQYFNNRLRLEQYAFQLNVVDQLGPTPPEALWGLGPHHANAEYDATYNEIHVMAGYLRSPLLDQHTDVAVQLGGLGAMFAHELSHAFDDDGIQFDATGSLRDWWTERDREAFEAKVARLRQQVNEMRPWPDRPELSPDGALTLAENIADLGALAIAYDALRAHLARHPHDHRRIGGFTPDQRFFMAWARMWRELVRPERLREWLEVEAHPPGKVRALLAPSNMPVFARAFACAPGDPMVRSADERVSIW